MSVCLSLADIGMLCSQRILAEDYMDESFVVRSCDRLAEEMLNPVQQHELNTKNFGPKCKSAKLIPQLAVRTLGCLQALLAACKWSS